MDDTGLRQRKTNGIDSAPEVAYSPAGASLDSSDAASFQKKSQRKGCRGNVEGRGAREFVSYIGGVLAAIGMSSCNRFERPSLSRIRREPFVVLEIYVFVRKSS